MDDDDSGIPTSGHDYRTPGVLKIMSIGDEAMIRITSAGVVTIHPRTVAYGGPEQGRLSVPGWNGSVCYSRGQGIATGPVWALCLGDIICDAIADGRIPLHREEPDV